VKIETVATSLVMIVVVYVLSVGPVSRFDESVHPLPGYMLAYYPLAWLADHSPAFGKAFDWYIRVWALSPHPIPKVKQPC
jgi:hypothetical protein